MLIEQVRCLSYLSKAYTLKKDHDRAYLANLEQLNAAEEMADDYWNEVTFLLLTTFLLGKEFTIRRRQKGKITEFYSISKEL